MMKINEKVMISAEKRWKTVKNGEKQSNYEKLWKKSGGKLWKQWKTMNNNEKWWKTMENGEKNGEKQ